MSNEVRQMRGFSNKLLELPGPALSLQVVLQQLQLDQRSLACTAVSCSVLNRAVSSKLRKSELCCKAPEATGSLANCLAQHSSSLTSLQFSTGDQCSIQPVLHFPPCPQLRNLDLQNVTMHLGPAGRSPGVLFGSTNLTSLVLERCMVYSPGASAAAAAIAAMPELRSLKLADLEGVKLVKALIKNLQLPQQLTHLSLGLKRLTTVEAQQLSQLSGLVNLQHLELTQLPSDGVPGGVPSQLAQLTCLKVAGNSCNAEVQLQHLSSLTALQHLSVNMDTLETDDIPGMQSLTKLTGLELNSVALRFTTDSTNSWGCLTALKTLALFQCTLQPSALSGLTQLQALSLGRVRVGEATDVTELLTVVSQLSLLTELRLELDATPVFIWQPCPADAFTALTASSNLRALRLTLPGRIAPPDYVLFRPGTVYPHLRLIDLASDLGNRAVPLSVQQLQLLHSCCPALVDLRIALFASSLPAAFQPLVPLAAVPQREVQAAVTAALGIVAQMTGLRQLELLHLPQPADPALLQLTALTALEQLTLWNVQSCKCLFLHSKACWFNPPDVWIQLLRHLLADAACRQVLLKRSSAAAAAPSELMLAQLAASLAEELAAGMPPGPAQA